MDLFTPPSKSLFSVCILALNFRWHVMLFSLLLCQKICSSPVLQHIQKKTKQKEWEQLRINQFHIYQCCTFNSGSFHASSISQIQLMSVS